MIRGRPDVRHTVRRAFVHKPDVLSAAVSGPKTCRSPAVRAVKKQ